MTTGKRAASTERKTVTPAREVAAPSGSHGMDHSALHHLLGYAIARGNVITRRAFQARIGEPLDLRPVEFSALVLLMENQNVTHARLARALALSAPNLTTLLDRLVERGLVRRERSETDRRAQLVTLTREGAQLARKAHQLSLGMEDEALVSLSVAERAMLIELLLRVGRLGDGR